MKSVEPGAVLEVLATDPGAVADFQAFCQTTGDELLSWDEADGRFTFQIRKAG